MKMNQNITNLLIAVCFIVTIVTAGAAEPVKRIPVTTESLNNTHQLIGPLGRPVGEVFTVDLKVTEKPDKGDFEDYVTVTAIDLKPLKQPVVMPARLWNWSDIKKLAMGQHHRVRVYQDAGMIGHPGAALRETVSIQTTAHTFVCWLVILKTAPGSK